MSTLARVPWRLAGDGRVATVASTLAVLFGAARASGQHPAPGAVPAWVGIGLGLLGLVTVAGAIATGGDR